MTFLGAQELKFVTPPRKEKKNKKTTTYKQKKTDNETQHTLYNIQAYTHYVQIFFAAISSYFHHGPELLP